MGIFDKSYAQQTGNTTGDLTYLFEADTRAATRVSPTRSSCQRHQSTTPPICPARVWSTGVDIPTLRFDVPSARLSEPSSSAVLTAVLSTYFAASAIHLSKRPVLQAGHRLLESRQEVQQMLSSASTPGRGLKR